MQLLALLIAAAIATPIAGAGEIDQPPEVPFIELSTKPFDFEGRRVQTAGILVMTEGGGMLFPSYAAASGGSSEESIWLDGDFYPETRITDQPVRVEGVFRNGRQGHLGGWTVGLQDVREVVADRRVPPPAPLWQLGPALIVLFSLMFLIPLVIGFGAWAGRRQ